MKNRWIKRLGVVTGVLLVMLAAIPFMISLDRYLPEIEKRATDALHQPVTIKGIRLALLPSPRVTLQDIAIGKTGDLKVVKVTVVPDLWSLTGAVKVIRSVDIDTLAVTQTALVSLAALGKSSDADGSPAAVRVEQLRVSNATLQMEKAAFGPFDAKVKLNAAGAPEEASVTTRDDKLKLTITPDKSNYVIDLQARAWKVPAEPAIVFDELKITGVATLTQADFSDVQAKLYGGRVSGKAGVGWQKGLQVRGNLDVEQVELASLVPMLAPGNRMSGKLSAKPVFSGNAADPAQLVQALRLQTPFHVDNGVLYGVDIAQAAASLIKRPAKGGETHFDQLSGHLNMERGAFRFTQLKIVSGVLAANGNVSISASKELSGRINAEVKALGVSTGVPLNVSGTVASPVLLPTGGTVAGAAVGTAVLGPGMGTSVGAKVGAWAGRLFGGGADDKTKK